MRALSAAALLGIAGLTAGFHGNADDQEAPDAVSADPTHYSVEFENDVVRLLRIRYGPGESSVMHHHPANCAVFLTPLSARMELPGGETVDAPGEAGQVQCFDAETHKPTNVGDEPIELILIELKGRAEAGS